MKRRIDDVVAEFEGGAAEDYVGLWEVVRAARENTEEGNGQDVQAITLELLKRMLSPGFRAGGFTQSGAWELWPDQNPESVIRRIKTEWNRLGRDPNIGDIVWFDRE